MLVDFARSRLTDLQENCFENFEAAAEAVLLDGYSKKIISESSMLEALQMCACDPSYAVGLINPRFGEPSVLLFETESWVFELIYWHSMVSAIHEHSYPGAFLTVGGRRAHLEFTWEEHRSVCGTSRCAIGQLKASKAQVLKPGVVTRILPFEKFIHTVWPLDRPCLTVVIRRKAPRKSLSYMLGEDGICLRFDEKIAEAEIVPRLHYLRSLMRWRCDISAKVMSDVLPGKISVSGLVYLGIAMEEEGETPESCDFLNSAEVYGEDFKLAFKKILLADRLFRSMYKLKTIAISPVESLALATIYFSSVLNADGRNMVKDMFEAFSAETPSGGSSPQSRTSR